MLSIWQVIGQSRVDPISKGVNSEVGEPRNFLECSTQWLSNEVERREQRLGSPQCRIRMPSSCEDEDRLPFSPLPPAAVGFL